MPPHAPYHLIARLWWRATARLWRANTLLIPVGALFAALSVYASVRVPTRNVLLYVSLVTSSSLVTALLLPMQLRAPSVLDSRRFDLLPIPPFTVFLLRLAFSNPFRLALTACAFACSVVVIMQLGHPPERGALDVLQLALVTLCGLIAVEVLEAMLRRWPSPLLLSPIALLLLVASVIFGTLGRLRVALASPAFAVPSALARVVAWQATAPIAEAAGAAIAPAVVAILLLAVAKAVTDAFTARPARSRPTRTMAGPIGGLARIVFPFSPGSLAKELAVTLRVPHFWSCHVCVLVAAAIAARSHGPAALSFAFVLWTGAAYNILGPDAPMSGLHRYALTPQPIDRVLGVRHMAIVLTGALIAGVTLVLLSALTARGAGADSPPTVVAYLVWFGYAASTFLLSTITGDWFSVHQPHAIGLRSLFAGAGTASTGVLVMVAWLGTYLASGFIALGWRVALGSTDVVRILILTALTQSGLYIIRRRFNRAARA